MGHCRGESDISMSAGVLGCRHGPVQPHRNNLSLPPSSHKSKMKGFAAALWQMHFVRSSF